MRYCSICKSSYDSWYYQNVHLQTKKHINNQIEGCVSSKININLSKNNSGKLLVDVIQIEIDSDSDLDTDIEG